MSRTVPSSLNCTSSVCLIVFVSFGLMETVASPCHLPTRKSSFFISALLGPAAGCWADDAVTNRTTAASASRYMEASVRGNGSILPLVERHRDHGCRKRRAAHVHDQRGADGRGFWANVAHRQRLVEPGAEAAAGDGADLLAAGTEDCR